MNFTNKSRFKIAENCPCGKSNKDGKFVPFNEYTDCGYCHSCGETFWPDEENDTGKVFSISGKVEIERQYIEPEFLKRTLSNYSNNIFYQWLIVLIGKEAANRIKSRFLIGTSKSGGVVWWMVNDSLQICQPKLMNYNTNGHREGLPFVPKGFNRDSGYSTCLFGLHQLSKNHKSSETLILVESEKTAVLGYYAFPKYIWLASGGATGLSQDKAKPLKGHKVLIVPDSDKAGRKGAEQTKERLSRLGIKSNVVDLFPDRNDGYDLADHIQNENTVVQKKGIVKKISDLKVA